MSLPPSCGPSPSEASAERDALVLLPPGPVGAAGVVEVVVDEDEEDDLPGVLGRLRGDASPEDERGAEGGLLLLLLSEWDGVGEEGGGTGKGREAGRTRKSNKQHSTRSPCSLLGARGG